jgi:acyl-CoA synthetase (AMP-forming)/AMP-acid ligase II
MLLHQLVEKNAIENPENVAIIFKKGKLAYKDLDQQAEKLAMAFLERGIQKADIVGILMPSRMEYIYTALAAWKIGAAILPVNYHYTDHEISYALTNADVQHLVMVDRYDKYNYLERLDNIRSLTPCLQNVYLLSEQLHEGTIDFQGLSDGEYDHLRQRYEEIHSSVNEEDIAFIVYTGGTTGIPKGAIITHKARYSVDKSWGDELKVDSSDVILVNLPLFHLYVWHTVIRSFISGAKIVLMEEYDTDKTLKLIQQEKVTFMAQVPTMYIYQYNHPEVDQLDLSSLRIGLTGGSVFPEEIFKDVQSKLGGLRIINFYGLTEDGGAVTLNRINDNEFHAMKTVGKPIPGVELKIVDDDRRELPINVTGEIAVRSAWIKGYYNNPEETAKAIDKDGWLYTGDSASLDEENYVILKGRKKDMFISGGENIYPAEIEAVLQKHPDVMMVAVTGTPHDKMGEVGRAYVVAKENANLTAKDIVDYCEDKLARIKIPREVVFRDALPLTAVGKIKKDELK